MQQRMLRLQAIEKFIKSIIKQYRNTAISVSRRKDEKPL
jgi:hypothetical protein